MRLQQLFRLDHVARFQSDQPELRESCCSRMGRPTSESFVVELAYLAEYTNGFLSLFSQLKRVSVGDEEIWLPFLLDGA